MKIKFICTQSGQAPPGNPPAYSCTLAVDPTADENREFFQGTPSGTLTLNNLREQLHRQGDEAEYDFGGTTVTAAASGPVSPVHLETAPTSEPARRKF